MEVGVRYDSSQEHTPEWFRSALADFMEHRLSGAFKISIERKDGTSIVGSLVAIDGDVILLDAGDLSGRGVHVEDVRRSLMLFSPPLDRSDELRG